MNDEIMVSIALFAYNQKDYIDKAIDAAFCQNYSNLEIILSDDCSSDGTFDIIKRRVAEYNGPHRVRARQSVSNAGTLRHVLEVARESRGEFLVLATGDDIQLPERTRILVDAWKKSNASAFSSAWHVINEEGALLERHVRPEAPRNLVWKYFKDRKDRRFMSGPTAAYNPLFLRALPLPRSKVFHEDTVFTFILHTLGLGISYTDQPTVEYRIHDKSYSNRIFSQSGFKNIKNKERATASYAKDTAAYLDYIINDFLSDAEKEYPNIADTIDIEFMKNHLTRSKIESSWIESTFFERLLTLARSRSVVELKTILPRLFGLNVFAFAKTIKLGK